MSSQDRKCSTLIIPDKVLEDHGSNISFAPGNVLAIFPMSKRARRPPYTTGSIHEVQWNTFFHNAVTRKFLNESHAIFVGLQKALEESKNGQKEQLEILTSTSRKYRSVVSVCHFNLQKAIENTVDDELRMNYSAQSELLYTTELIWNLCEVLFIETTQAGCILSQLLEWIRWHSDEGDQRVLEAMAFETMDAQPVYWEAVYCFVLQGKIENTRKLLKRNRNGNREDFLSADELLRKMPIYQHNSGKSIAEFGLLWKRWQEECKQRLDGGEFASMSELETLAKILCGDRNTFHDLSDLCGTWYHAMVSWLLYTNPCVKGQDLASIAKESWNWFSGSDAQSALDQILISAMSYDLIQVLIQLCYFPDSWWFLAHLCDLLFHSNQPIAFVDTLNISENAGTLREFFLLNYSSSLMSHSSLWQIGVDYLDCCPENGRQFLECYLERILLSTHSKALKVLELAQKRDMKHLVRSVCIVMAKQASRNGQIGTALTWALRAGDSAYVSHLADRFLQEYCESGRFSSLDLLDSLGSSMLVSDRLTFLGKYREFHRLYENKQLKLAAGLLISLLASNLAPKYFWMTLLMDSIPLLEAEVIAFSSQQTHQLLYSLQELNPPDDEKILMLRLSIARNLARAFIEESSSVY